MTPLTALPSWQALTAHHAEIKDLHLRTLFGGGSVGDHDQFSIAT